MSFHYMSGSKRYSFSYQESLEEYWRVLRLSDDEFAATSRNNRSSPAGPTRASS